MACFLLAPLIVFAAGESVIPLGDRAGVVIVVVVAILTLVSGGLLAMPRNSPKARGCGIGMLAAFAVWPIALGGTCAGFNNAINGLSL